MDRLGHDVTGPIVGVLHGVAGRRRLNARGGWWRPVTHRGVARVRGDVVSRVGHGVLPSLQGWGAGRAAREAVLEELGVGGRERVEALLGWVGAQQRGRVRLGARRRRSGRVCRRWLSACHRGADQEASGSQRPDDEQGESWWHGSLFHIFTSLDAGASREVPDAPDDEQEVAG
jgi:hypothetical protein